MAKCAGRDVCPGGGGSARLLRRGQHIRHRSRAVLRMRPFIHIGCLGVPTATLGELRDLRYARPRKTAAAILEHRDIALGGQFRGRVMAVGRTMWRRWSWRCRRPTRPARGRWCTSACRALPAMCCGACGRATSSRTVSPDAATAFWTPPAAPCCPKRGRRATAAWCSTWATAPAASAGTPR